MTTNPAEIVQELKWIVTNAKIYHTFDEQGYSAIDGVPLLYHIKAALNGEKFSDVSVKDALDKPLSIGDQVARPLGQTFAFGFVEGLNPRADSAVVSLTEGSESFAGSNLIKITKEVADG